MISVCMATYNGENYIRSQISSILPQLGENDELIISDDGSTDATLDIISEINDSRIILLKNNSHCYTANFENALIHAKGDYIFLSDQDDIWRDDKVKIAINYLQKYNFLMSNARIVDANANVIQESRNDVLNVGTGFLKNLIKTYNLGCCMCFDRHVLEAVLPFPKNRELCLHDAWITMIAELCFKTYVCDEPLIDYRRHGTNVSFGSFHIHSSIPQMINIRRYLFIESLKRRKELRSKGLM